MSEVFLSKGHEKSFLDIKKLYLKNSLPHAILLSGQKSIGKSLFAKDVASLILCESAHSPCGVCKSCIFIKKNEHPDVIVHDCKEASDAQSIRALLSSLSLRPFFGEKRVTILVDAEDLTPQSSNILLKTLEEPPAGAYFILTSSAPSKLLRTITSRCQNTQLSTLSKKDVSEILLSHGITQSLDTFYDGTLQMLSMSEDEFALSKDIFSSLVRARNKDYYALSEILSSLPKEKPQLRNIILLLRNSVRNSMMQGNFEFEPLLTNLLEAERLIFDRNLNPQIVFATIIGLFMDNNPLSCYITEQIEGAE